MLPGKDRISKHVVALCDFYFDSPNATLSNIFSILHLHNLTDYERMATNRKKKKFSKTASEMNFQVLPKNPETNTLQNDCIIILK